MKNAYPNDLVKSKIRALIASREQLLKENASLKKAQQTLQAQASLQRDDSALLREKDAQIKELLHRISEMEAPSAAPPAGPSEDAEETLSAETAALRAREEELASQNGVLRARVSSLLSQLEELKQASARQEAPTQPEDAPVQPEEALAPPRADGHAEELQALRGREAEAQEKCRQLTEQNNELYVKLRDSSDRLAAAEAELARLKQAGGELASQNEALAREKDSLLVQRREYEERVARLEAQLARARTEEEQLSIRLGRVFIEVQASAQRILERANLEAERIRSGAASANGAFLQELEQMQSELRDVQSNVGELFREFNGRVDDLEQMLERARGRLASPGE